MVSTIRYPSGKHVDMQTKTHLMPFVALMVFIAAVVLFKEIALLFATLGYIFFGIIRHLRRRHRIKAAPHSL
jgi:CDP-diacylglycerol--serine O-phosphatidyltransferase